MDLLGKVEGSNLSFGACLDDVGLERISQSLAARDPLDLFQEIVKRSGVNLIYAVLELDELLCLPPYLQPIAICQARSRHLMRGQRFGSEWVAYYSMIRSPYF